MLSCFSKFLYVKIKPTNKSRINPTEEPACLSTVLVVNSLKYLANKSVSGLWLVSNKRAEGGTSLAPNIRNKFCSAANPTMLSRGTTRHNSRRVHPTLSTVFKVYHVKVGWFNSVSGSSNVIFVLPPCLITVTAHIGELQCSNIYPEHCVRRIFRTSSSSTTQYRRYSFPSDSTVKGEQL